MQPGAALNRMDRNPALGVPQASKWYTFVLHRFDGTTDRIDTADPEAAAFVVRGWERDPRTRFVTIQGNGGKATLIYGERADLGILNDMEAAHGAPVECHNDWCPLFPDPRFSDICRKCPNVNVNL